MSISVHVHVDRAQVSNHAWARVYDETLEVVRRWPDPAMARRIARRHGVDVAIYTRDVEDAHGWQVCGDARTRGFGEAVAMPKALGVKRAGTSCTDAIVPVIFEGGGRLECLLDGNTHGRAYHGLALALAMLIEHRLPGAAVADGDFSRADAERARLELERIIGQRVAVPVVRDRERLRARLSGHVRGAALDDAITIADDSLSAEVQAFAADLLGVLRRGPERVFDDLDAAVVCSDLADLDDDARQVLSTLVQHAARAVRDAEPIATGPIAPHERLLQSIARDGADTRLVLTEMAWAEIEQADVDLLEMLVALARLHCDALLWSRARRAIFESSAVRSLAQDEWRRGPAG